MTSREISSSVFSRRALEEDLLAVDDPDARPRQGREHRHFGDVHPNGLASQCVLVELAVDGLCDLLGVSGFGRESPS